MTRRGYLVAFHRINDTKTSICLLLRHHREKYILAWFAIIFAICAHLVVEVDVHSQKSQRFGEGVTVKAASGGGL